MIKLYTNLDKFKNCGGILSVDAYFNFNVNSSMFSNKVLEVLKKYENATLVGNNILSGSFGPFLITNISSGVKALILLI